jgi:hypothetical protein
MTATRNGPTRLRVHFEAGGAPGTTIEGRRGAWRRCLSGSGLCAVRFAAISSRNGWHGAIAKRCRNHSPSAGLNCGHYRAPSTRDPNRSALHSVCIGTPRDRHRMEGYSEFIRVKATRHLPVPSLISMRARGLPVLAPGNDTRLTMSGGVAGPISAKFSLNMRSSACSAVRNSSRRWPLWRSRRRCERRTTPNSRPLGRAAPAEQDNPLVLWSRLMSPNPPRRWDVDGVNAIRLSR